MNEWISWFLELYYVYVLYNINLFIKLMYSCRKWYATAITTTIKRTITTSGIKDSAELQETPGPCMSQSSAMPSVSIYTHRCHINISKHINITLNCRQICHHLLLVLWSEKIVRKIPYFSGKFQNFPRYFSGKICTYLNNIMILW